ncbi:MAG: hypothetical protein QF464_03805, partial [Myxococcota bacterium]|nr:hypothetical protein [Myxococcota bacterium]
LQSYGEPATSGPALITNLAPVAGGAVITAGDGGLHCVPQDLTDPDGDAVTVAYRWLVNGLVLAGETDAFLSSTTLIKDDEVRCVVTPNDGTTEGQPVTSDPYFFSNDGPTTPAVTVGPAGAAPGDALTCSATATDPDGDDLTYTYTWLQDGVEQGAYTQADLPGGVTGSCQTWTCEVTAYDGDVTSAPGSGSLTLGPTGGATGGDYVWFGEHSAPGDATSGDVVPKNEFFKTEKAATRITIDSPGTLTHVRFYGDSDCTLWGFFGGPCTQGYEITLYLDGAVPQIPLGSGATATFQPTGPGMHIAQLEAPLEINTPMSIWVVIGHGNDYWYAAGDTNGRQTDNLIAGCDADITTFECVSSVAWQTVPWPSLGDFVVDVGYESDGEPVTCD